MGFATATAIAAGGYFGYQWLALVIVTTVFVLALSWPALAWVPQWLTGSAIVLGSGALATVGVLLGDERPLLMRHIVIALAFGALAALIIEVIRPSPTGHVLTAVAGNVTGVAVATSAASWIAAARTPGGELLVVTGAIALAVAAVASAATSTMTTNAMLALGLGSIAGGASGALLFGLPWLTGIVVGLLCAASVVVVHELTRRDTENTRRLSGIAAGITPVTVAGVLVYIAGRLLIG